MTPQSSPGEPPEAQPAEPNDSPDAAATPEPATPPTAFAAQEPASDPAPAADAEPVTPPATEPVAEPVTDQPAGASTIDWAKTGPATAADDDLTRNSEGLTGEFIAPAPAADDTAEEPDAAPAVTGGPQDTLFPLVGSLIALVAIAALLIVAFVLPASKGALHNVPIGVAGSEEFKAQVRSVLSENSRGEFAIRSYPSEAALRTAIDNRDVYGGLALGQNSINVLVASAASIEVAQALNTISGGQIPVSDVRPFPAKDQLGAALSAAGTPLAITALLPALLLIRVQRKRPLAQLGTAIAASFAMAAAAAALLTYWIGATQGANFWLLTVALAAGFLSTSLLLLGLNAVAGRIGLGIGIAALVFVSVPLAGFTNGPEWLPEPWGGIGTFLPAGAAGTLLRNAAFFDGNAAGIPLAVLGAWALAGLLMLLLSEGLTPKDPQPQEPVLPPAPADEVLSA